MRVLSALLLLALLLTSLLACSQTPPAPCEHTDENSDLVCDTCGSSLPPAPTCTAHADANADLSCDVCGAFVDESVAGWLLDGVPTYRDGTLAKALYLAGQGIDAAQLPENENTLQTVSGTTAEEFESYLAKLGLAGYQREFSIRRFPGTSGWDSRCAPGPSPPGAM